MATNIHSVPSLGVAMHNSEDVTALFRKFGGSADTYQEIVSRDQAGAAEQKWPMLNQIRPMGHVEAPSVRSGSQLHGAERMKQAPLEPGHALLQGSPEVKKSIKATPVIPGVALRPVSVEAHMAPAAHFSAGGKVEAATLATAESAPAFLPPASPSSRGDLKSMFVRMAAAQPSEAAEADENPLKRLIKW